MAIRGRKPKPTVLRLLTGNAGKRPLPPPDPLPAGSIERPDGLQGAAAALWDRFIARAWWLTWADGPKALMWCHLQAEFEADPAGMRSARITQLRALGSELGFDQAARTRMGIASPKPPSPADEYLT
jgi:hypothetical protein